jgi:beta-glucosidase
MTVAQLDIDALVAQLTIEEKASLCLGSDFWHTAEIERLGIPKLMVSDGPHGLRAQLDEADHVGIGGSVPATCFPPAAGIASSWNPDLCESVGKALAREARKWGVSVVLGPGINMKRSPLCGRNFEYLSEDPWLAGELARAMVSGVQSLGVGTSVKHYAANNQEGDRLRVSAEVDERTLREIYLPAFERVVTKARPWTVMCAYNKVNGTYASEHRWLLTEVLRDEWGYTGVVVSDWGAVHDRVAALAAGLDLEMPPDLERSAPAIIAAVTEGRLSEALLDLTVRRMLRLISASMPALAEGGDFDEAEHHALARQAAHESAVLLKNEGGVLPLAPAAGSTVAVIGEFAQTPRYQGAGSSQVNPTRVDVPLDELKSALGEDVTVTFAPGFGVGRTDDDEKLAAEAVEAARAADHVIAFLGLPSTDESEGFDRSQMDLPANQIALVESLAEVSDRLIVVLANGSSVITSTWQDKVAAILECWLSGQAAGGAAADLLTGKVNPSGKLAETIPVRLQDNTSYLNFPGDSGLVRYGEGIFIGYRGYDATELEVSYPFGFGLSYTTFEISDLEVSQQGSVEDEDLAVEAAVTVTNTGATAGAEVVQVYVRDVESSVARPIRELKGFTKVWLEPGESQRVTIGLDERSFAFWSIRLGKWAVEGGEFEIAAGSSSRDLAVSQTITIDAPTIAPPLDADSTLQEWLADGLGSTLLGRLAVPMFSDPELVKVIGTMPLRTLASFGVGLAHQKLDELLEELRGSQGAERR